MHQTPVLKPFLYFFLERMFLWNRAPSRQITTHKQPISAPCDLTSADQIVSQMNQLAAPLLGGFRAVGIEARLKVTEGRECPHAPSISEIRPAHVGSSLSC